MLPPVHDSDKFMIAVDRVVETFAKRLANPR